MTTRPHQKVHHKDVKKISMFDKVSDLYEEEQDNKVRNTKKILSLQKMSDLEWKLQEKIYTNEIEDSCLSPHTAVLKFILVCNIANTQVFQVHKSTAKKTYRTAQNILGNQGD